MLKVPVRFFNRVEILALNILDQCYLDYFLVLIVSDYSGNFLKLGNLCGPEPALSCDYLVTVLALLLKDQRFNYTMLLDRIRQFVQPFLIEGLSGLILIGVDLINAHQSLSGCCLCLSVLCLGDVLLAYHCIKSLSQSALNCHLISPLQYFVPFYRSIYYILIWPIIVLLSSLFS